MLHGFPYSAGFNRQSLQRSGNIAYAPTSIVAGTPLGTYGASWTEVIASTPFESTYARITSTTDAFLSGGRSDLVMKVAIGPSSQEQELIGPMLWGGRPAYSSYVLPISIPKGSRISMKTAAGVAAKSIGFTFDILSGPVLVPPPRKWVSYGVTNVASGVGAYGVVPVPGIAPTTGVITDLETTTMAHHLWMPMMGVGPATSIPAMNVRYVFRPGSTTAPGTSTFPSIFGSTGITETLGAFGSTANALVLAEPELTYLLVIGGTTIGARTMIDTETTAPTDVVSVGALAGVQ